MITVAAGAALVATIGVGSPVLAAVTFDSVVIDATLAGDVKIVADINGDGLTDLIVGGSRGEGLNWYRSPAMQRTRIAVPTVQFTTDGAAGDIDGDGDLDLVVPDGNGANNLVWFRNPRPSGNPETGGLWQRRTIGSVGGWGKDVKVADFDGDSRRDVAVRSTTALTIFFQRTAGAWTRIAIRALPSGEGMAMGDVDRDGRADLILRGAWLRNPGGSAARTAGGWTSYAIGNAPANFKALVEDIDGDGRPEVVFSSSENTANVTLWRMLNGNPRNGWVATIVITGLDRAHTLRAGDIDRDGDNDLVVAQMHTSTLKRIIWVENRDGQGRQWLSHVIGSQGLHNGQVLDADGDGDIDIFGANWTGNNPVRLWRQRN